MTHRRMRTWMALAAGGDLEPRRARRLEAHLADCPDCREENRQLLRSLELTRSLADKERTPDWSQGEWRKVISRAVAQEIRPRRIRFTKLPGWAWAAGAALSVVLAVGAVMLSRRRHVPNIGAEWANIVLPEKTQSVQTPAAIEPSARGGPKAAVARPGTPLAQKPLHAGTPEHARTASEAQPMQTQSVMAMTFVSRETGLKVHWVFNDAFDYKEKTK
jgi:anti-sigma factor RsiW